MTDQHTVVDTTKTAAQPAVTDASAPGDADTLESLISQFENDTKPAPAATQPEPKTTPQPTSAPVLPDRIVRLEQKLLQDEINEATSNVFGDLKVPHMAKIGWLREMATQNPEIEQAFQKKDTDPRTWSRFVKVLQKEAQKQFTNTVDETVTADTMAVTASMRGASTKVTAEPAPNLGHMSDAELRDYTRKNFGF